jgi:hypothetical protein
MGELEQELRLGLLERRAAQGEREAVVADRSREERLPGASDAVRLPLPTDGRQTGWKTPSAPFHTISASTVAVRISSVCAKVPLK